MGSEGRAIETIADLVYFISLLGGLQERLDPISSLPEVAVEGHGCRISLLLSRDTLDGRKEIPNDRVDAPRILFELGLHQA
jgi:hypothetical protein